MNADRLRWLYHRSRSMSAAEIRHRVAEAIKRAYDSRRQFAFKGADAALPVIPGLRERVIGASLDVRESLQIAALRVHEGRYNTLGQIWPAMGAVPDWHLDPVSGARWPSNVFCFAVPFRGNRSLGDVKYVWEINRLQHLQLLAAHALCQNDHDAAKLCVEQIRSWIVANPPFRGVNWASGIELALRLVSLVVVFSLLPEESFTKDDRRAINTALTAHLYWLARYPSLYSSANNHLVAEAGGLFVVGTLAPYLRGSREAATQGHRILTAEAMRQILPDGVPAEQSPTYGAFTTEWLLAAHAVATAAGVPGLHPNVLERLTAFGAFLDWIADANGNIPRIGDDDEGRVISGQGDSRDYLSSVRTSLGSPLPSNSTEGLRHLVFDAPISTTTAPNPIGVRTFAHGGYSILRESADGHESMLVFDHGPLGYLGIAAHGHADALAIWLHVNGKPILVDAGTYLYHSGAQWRLHFRGTAAHNTLLLDGADQSIPSGDFNWSAKAVVRLVSCTDERIVAEHNGYARRYGLLHRRSVGRPAPGRYDIEDTLVGAEMRPHTEVGFLTAPNLAVEGTATGWRVTDGAQTTVLLECPDADRSMERGWIDPIRGWTSHNFGSKESATRLVGRLKPGARSLATRLIIVP